MCLEYMTPAIAEDIIASGKLNNANYFCLKALVTLNDTLKLKPLQKFHIIAQWSDYDIINRSCHIESLLSAVQFHLIDHTDIFHKVQTWFMDIKSIQDEIKCRIIKKITRSLKTVTVSSSVTAEVDVTQSTASDWRPFMLITNVEELIEKLLNVVKKTTKNKTNKKTNNKTELYRECLTNDEAIAAVYYKWKDLDGIKRQMAVEYFVGKPDLVCKQNITDILLLYEIGFTMKQLLNNKFDLFKSAIQYVDCGIISVNILQIFFADFYPIITTKSANHCIYIIQLLMRWAIVHTGQFGKVTRLLKEICTCRLPDDYLKLVLFPYLKNLANGDVNICGKHQQKIHDFNKGVEYDCLTYRLTSEIDFFQNNSSYKGLDTVSFHHLYIGTYHGFILFDKDVCMKEFPCYREQDLTIDELRELYAKYLDLHVMIF